MELRPIQVDRVMSERIMSHADAVIKAHSIRCANAHPVICCLIEDTIVNSRRNYWKGLMVGFVLNTIVAVMVVSW